MPDIPYELMERILRNSHDACQYCKRKFKDNPDLGRVYVRFLQDKPLYDPRNTALMCHICYGPIEWFKEHIVFAIKDR